MYVERNKRGLTIEFEELGVQRRRDRLVVWVVLCERDAIRQNQTGYKETVELTYASKYGCARASSTVIRFFGSNV